MPMTPYPLRSDPKQALTQARATGWRGQGPPRPMDDTSASLEGIDRTILVFSPGLRDQRRGLRAEYQEQAGTGKFTAVFLIQCPEAIDTSSLCLSDG